MTTGLVMQLARRHSVGVHVLVTGGTGFVGSRLVRALVARGDRVTVMSRGGQEKVSRRFGSEVDGWSDPRGLGAHGVEAVVNLAGAQAVGVRLSAETKRRIRESRLELTQALVQAIQQAPPERRPRVLVSASAVGYYGSLSPEEQVDETGAAGTGFLAQLAVDWEAEADRARHAGVRVVLARFGLVLGDDGGALPVMARPLRLFLGGPLGSGTQAVSWVHVDDAVGAVLHALKDPDLQGAINVTAPEPVTNAEFTAQLGRALRRPSWLRVPATAVRFALGREGAEPLLGGQRVVPARLQQAGFKWRYPELEEALKATLGPGGGASDGPLSVTSGWGS